MKKSPRLSVGLVFDDTLDSTDGVAQYVKTLGGWLNAQGHRVSYFVGETKLETWRGGTVYSLAKNQTVKFNGNKLSMPVAASGRKINQALAAAAPDVLHVMTPYSPFMGAKLIKRASVQTAVAGTFHIFPSGPLSSYGSRALKLWLGSSLKRFDACAAVSPVAAEFAQSAYGLTCSVVPNPVDVASLKVPHTDQAKRIVFLGRLVKRKGAKELITAFARLTKDQPQASLIVAGDGPQRAQLEVLAKKLRVDDKVEFKGFINEADKPELLASAAIACFPSLYGESFGIVLIEAMAAGSGVVLGGDNPGYRSVLGQRPELLFDPKDEAALAAKLNDMLGGGAKLHELHQWQANAVKQYDIGRVGQQIEALYDKALIARRTKKSNN